MFQKIQNYIHDHELLRPDLPVVVGVSGGADSVVLLRILLELGYQCIVVHCNFHLRMDESNRDELFVRNLVGLLELESYFVDFETNKYASEHGISIEMAARELRYQYFEEIRKKVGAQAIAVAHHADDSIETLLMNLVRGTGLRGLTGINCKNDVVVRPLLCCNRQEIELIARLKHWEYVIDSTNASSDYQRNKFRNEVLPLLEEINPSVRRTLYATTERMRATLNVYEQAIQAGIDRVVEKSEEAMIINIAQLKKESCVEPLLFEILNDFGFSTAVIRQVEQHMDSQSGKKFYSSTHCLVRDRENFIIYPIADTENVGYELYIEDDQLLEPIGLVINKFDKTIDFQPSRNSSKVHLDASRLKFPLKIRKWSEGDVFYPFGLNKRKKISDFFIDNKFSLLQKEQTWLLISGDEIVWVIGHRTDHRYRITDETTSVLELILRS